SSGDQKRGLHAPSASRAANGSAFESTRTTISGMVGVYVMTSADSSTAIRLLLASSSRVHGSGWLDPCADEIREFLHAGRVKRALFVPHALKDRDAYAKKARERLAAIGIELDALHEAKDAPQAVARADPVVF